MDRFDLEEILTSNNVVRNIKDNKKELFTLIGNLAVEDNFD